MEMAVSMWASWLEMVEDMKNDGVHEGSEETRARASGGGYEKGSSGFDRL